MPKRRSEDPENVTSQDSPSDERAPHRGKRKGLARRDFVKLVGGTGVAVSTGLLTDLLKAQEAGPKLLGPAAVSVTLRVNGGARKLMVEPRTTLLDALRDYLGLTGAKKVCDRAVCGACTVIINGKPVYACGILAIDAAESGADIRTIEGLAPEGRLHAVSAAFVENDAQQCGFCTPGFVMASKAYLDQHPKPAHEEIQRALGGNLCRCGTYMGVRKAVLDAAMRLRG